MSTKHTPGPWDWHGPYRTGAYKVSALAADGSQTIDVMIDRSEDNSANARLIAAAPDLFAALRTADEWCQMGLNSSDPTHWEAALQDCMACVRAAIAKVEA